MRHSRFIPVLIACAVLARLAMAAPVAGSAGRFAITTDRIAAAVDSVGMQVLPAQVTLLSEVSAATPTPRLTVKSIQPMGDDRAMVRLECGNPEECVPFFVRLRFNHSAQQAAAAPLPQMQTVAAPVAPMIRSGPASYLVHAGVPATLLMDGPHIHIRVSVICLQNGAAGQAVRVTDKDHKQIYIGEVVSDGVLRGRL